MSIDNSNENVWHERMISDNRRGVFSLKLHTQILRREDPPKLGPDDDQLEWYEISVWLTLGGKPVSDPVRFPAHEPLDARTAFAAAMSSALLTPASPAK